MRSVGPLMNTPLGALGSSRRVRIPGRSAFLLPHLARLWRRMRRALSLARVTAGTLLWRTWVVAAPMAGMLSARFFATAFPNGPVVTTGPVHQILPSADARL